jgi:hypothetical protein
VETTEDWREKGEIEKKRGELIMDCKPPVPIEQMYGRTGLIYESEQEAEREK